MIGERTRARGGIKRAGPGGSTWRGRTRDRAGAAQLALFRRTVMERTDMASWPAFSVSSSECIVRAQYITLSEAGLSLMHTC